MMVVPLESTPGGLIIVELDDDAVDFCCGTVGRNVCGGSCWNDGVVIVGGPLVVLLLSTPARYSSHVCTGDNWEIKLLACSLTSRPYSSQDWVCVVVVGLFA